MALVGGALLEAQRLLSLSAREVIRNDHVFQDEDAATVAQENVGLRQELLLSGNEFPRGLKLIFQLNVEAKPGATIALARVFRIDRSAATGSGRRPARRGCGHHVASGQTGSQRRGSSSTV
jgi:hypothetical protein